MRLVSFRRASLGAPITRARRVVAPASSASGPNSSSKGGKQGASERPKLVTSVFENLPLELLSADLTPPAPNSSDGAIVEGSGEERTVYSLRFRTVYQRGAALSEPYAGVSVLLVSHDGRALLHRVSSVNDPEETARQMRAICEQTGADPRVVGATCALLSPRPPQSGTAAVPPPLASTSYIPPHPKAGEPRPRFQEGNVDEVAFLGIDIGCLAGVLVGTESGSWGLDELDVSSSRTGVMERFMCREKVGQKAGLGAQWLTPVPEGAVVYGTGETAVVLTPGEAQALRLGGMQAYASTKQRLLLATAALTACGSGVAIVIGGPSAALPFALGGAAGLVYQLLLQIGVDASLDKAAAAERQELSAVVQAAAKGVQPPPPPLPLAPQPPSASNPSREPPSASEPNCEALEQGLREPGVGDIVRGVAGGARAHGPDLVRGVAGNPAVRLGFVAAAALAAASSLHNQGLVTQAIVSCEGMQCMVGSSAKEGASKLLLGLLGFLTYKVALVGVSLQPDDAPPALVTAAKQYEKEKNK
ncbi:hypothetical protein FOA52_005218 [Chlamydomonas sp. UWO 241]|nr:hypothetical protein FOA52_005218 [Chlamydomonas sp. UWO 241]